MVTNITLRKQSKNIEKLTKIIEQIMSDNKSRNAYTLKLEVIDKHSDYENMKNLYQKIHYICKKLENQGKMTSKLIESDTTIPVKRMFKMK